MQGACGDEVAINTYLALSLEISCAGQIRPLFLNSRTSHNGPGCEHVLHCPTEMGVHVENEGRNLRRSEKTVWRSGWSEKRKVVDECDKCLVVEVEVIQEAVYDRRESRN